MPSPGSKPRAPSLSGLPSAPAAAALSVALLLVGALVWFVPFLTTAHQPVAEVPAPAALSVLTPFPVAPRTQACMYPVTVTPGSEIAQFGLRPAAPSASGGPPVELVLSARDYHATLAVPGGYPGGSVALPIAPPRRAEIASACFVNRGVTTVLLSGTNEARTLAAPETTIAGRPASGDIALTFLRARQISLLDRLGEVFGHASNLTDDLVPSWLIWIIAFVIAFGVPAAAVAALYRALREDEVPAAG
jgi:hypothetical protein